MVRRSPFLALGVLASVALSGAVVAQGNGPPAAKPGLVVGVVDIGLVFKGYKKKEELEKLINARKDALEKQRQQKLDEIQKARKDLELAKEGTEHWRNKRYEILEKSKILEVAMQRGEDELRSMVKENTLKLLDEIETAVKDYGKKQAYDLILRVESKVDLGTKGWLDDAEFQERVFRAQTSAVLWHDAKLDITQSVLQILNKPPEEKKP